MSRSSLALSATVNTASCSMVSVTMPSSASRAKRSSRVAGIVEADIVDAIAEVAKFVGEMAHGREDEDDLLPVVADIAGFGVDLAEKDHVLLRIGTGKARHRRGQLVSKKEHQIAHGPHDRHPRLARRATDGATETGLVFACLTTERPTRHRQRSRRSPTAPARR